MLWSFDKADNSVTSPHALALRDGAAVITLKATESNRLIEFKQLPPCDKPRIGGVTLKLRAESIQAAKDAKLSVILLSKANHWMPLGDIPLAKLSSEWSRHDLKLPDVSWREAMPDLYSILVLLQNAKGASGVISLDDVGVLTRH